MSKITRITSSSCIDIEFVKMHGLGNDFVLVQMDQLFESIKQLQNLKSFVISMGNRYTGIGFDQLILYKCLGLEAEANNPVYEMRIFNPDGSEAQMCGNATRCLASLVYVNTNTRNVLIKSGPDAKELQCTIQNTAESVNVNVGKVSFHAYWIPTDQNIFLESLNTNIPDLKLLFEKIICVDVGNPHIILFQNHTNGPLLSQELMNTIGHKFQNPKLFPDGINVSFALIISTTQIQLSVWERGVNGLTLACGSGACGTFAAAVKLGYCSSSLQCEIMFKLGSLKLSMVEKMSEGQDQTRQEIIMEGPVKFVGRGTYCF